MHGKAAQLPCILHSSIAWGISSLLTTNMHGRSAFDFVLDFSYCIASIRLGHLIQNTAAFSGTWSDGLSHGQWFWKYGTSMIVTDVLRWRLHHALSNS